MSAAGQQPESPDEPPCHARPPSEWCDRNGPGGFMGHTCRRVSPQPASTDEHDQFVAWARGEGYPTFAPTGNYFGGLWHARRGWLAGLARRAAAEAPTLTLANLARYDPHVAMMGYDHVAEMPEREGGEWVRFADVEELLASTGATPEAPASEQQADAWMVGLQVFKTRVEAEANIRDPDIKPLPMYRDPAAATTASQKDAGKLLAMRADYDRKEGEARGMLMGGATTASASGEFLGEVVSISEFNGLVSIGLQGKAPKLGDLIYGGKGCATCCGGGKMFDLEREYTEPCDDCKGTGRAPAPSTTASASFQKFDLTDYSKPAIYSNSADRAPAPSRNAAPLDALKLMDAAVGECDKKHSKTAAQPTNPTE